MDRIRFNINRKRSFKGCLLRCGVFVNGKASPEIKNGGSTSFSVKRERVVFIQGDGSIRNNAVVHPSFEDEFGLDIRLTGNINNGYRIVFFPEGSDTPCPSVSFDRLLDGLEGEGTLNEAQKKLALLVFVMEAFDTEEVLRSKHAGEIVPVLKSLGAELYASTLERVLASQFSGCSLPIEGDNEAMAERVRKAEEIIYDADENYRLTEELSRTAANYISENYNELFTETDIYRFDGSFDTRCFGKKKREQPKSKPNKKQILRITLASFVFLALLGGMFALWRNSAYYPVRAALEKNTKIVTVTNPEIELEEGYGKYASDKINIKSAGTTYTMDWGNKPVSVGRDSEVFVEIIKTEKTLTLVVRDDNRICAVSGEETTYMSVDEFNSYQKKQSVIGTVLLAFFAFLVLLVFAAVILAIRWHDWNEN